MLLFFSGVLFSDKWGGYGGGTREMFLLFNKAFISSRTWKAILGWEGILRPTQSVRTLEMVEMGTCTDVFMLTLYKENTTVIHVV